MTQSLLYFLVILFFVLCTVDGGKRTSSSSSQDNYYGGSYYDNSKQSNDLTNLKRASAPNGKASGGGLGAWGYVAIMLTMIGVGAGIYYFTLFYPILCKRERKYDVMELSAV